MCDSDFEDNEYDDNDVSEETKQIQQKFMNIVEEMIEKKIEFPKEYKSFYLITEWKDPRGHGITLKPFLNQENAELKKPDDRQWTLYNSTNNVSTIVSYQNKVNLDCCHKSYKYGGGASYNIKGY